MTTFIIPTDKGNKLISLDTTKPLDKEKMFHLFLTRCDKLFWEIEMNEGFDVFCARSSFGRNWVLEVRGDNGVRSFESIEEISL